MIFQEAVDLNRLEKALESLTRLSLNVERRTLRQVNQILRQLRRDIVLSLVDAPSFQMSLFASIVSDIDAAVATYNFAFLDIISTSSNQMFDIGIRQVDDSLKISGVNTDAFPSLDRTPLEITKAIRYEQILKIGIQDINGIKLEIQNALSGEISVSETIQRIGKNISTDGTRFKSVTNRAEAIVRTELNRVLNLGTESRAKQVSLIEPDMKKFWINVDRAGMRITHNAVESRTNPESGEPIGVNELFLVGGQTAFGPHSPSLSAKNVVNCRCRLGFIIEDEDDIQTEQF